MVLWEVQFFFAQFVYFFSKDLEGFGIVPQLVSYVFAPTWCSQKKPILAARILMSHETCILRALDFRSQIFIETSRF